MNKLRTPLILLLTLLLLITGAYLPGIVCFFRELSALGKPNVSPVQQIILRLEEPTLTDSGVMFQKLALERHMQTIPVTEKEASKSSDQIYQAVEKQMDAYLECGLFQWFSYTQRTAEPYLAVDEQDPDNYAIIWAVDYACKDETYHNLFLHVDDSTGTILKMDYYTDQVLYPPEEQQLCFEGWCTSYFDALDLAAGSEYVQSLDTWTDVYRSGDVLTVTYCFQEIEFGLVCVSFTMNPNGFYISFSNSQEVRK